MLVPDDVRRVVLDAVAAGRLPAGGPSELVARDLVADAPAAWWDRWSELAATRVRPLAKADPEDEDEPAELDEPHRGWRQILGGLPGGELGPCAACGRPAPAAEVVLGRPGYLCPVHWIDAHLGHPYRDRDALLVDELVWVFGPRRPLRPCAPDAPLAAGTFRGGPLDGQRRPVSEHGPSWVRVHHAGGVDFYAHRRGTARTYTYAGSWLNAVIPPVTYTDCEGTR